jgi:hypothetical protein
MTRKLVRRIGATFQCAVITYRARQPTEMLERTSLSLGHRNRQARAVAGEPRSGADTAYSLGNGLENDLSSVNSEH